MITAENIFSGQWKELRPKIKQQWKALTDNDLSRASGSTEVLADILSEKYGYTRDKALEEINQFAQMQAAPAKVSRP